METRFGRPGTKFFPTAKVERIKPDEGNPKIKSLRRIRRLCERARGDRRKHRLLKSLALIVAFGLLGKYHRGEPITELDTGGLVDWTDYDVPILKNG